MDFLGFLMHDIPHLFVLLLKLLSKLAQFLVVALMLNNDELVDLLPELVVLLDQELVFLVFVLDGLQKASDLHQVLLLASDKIMDPSFYRS